MRSVSKGERFWRGYARIVVALRFVIVAGWIAAAVAAAWFLPSLSSAGGSPLGDIVPSESAALDAQQRAFELFGAAVATDTILVERNPRGLSDRELKANADAALAAREQRLPEDLSGVRAAVPLVNVKVAGTPWREERTTALTYLFMQDDLSLGPPPRDGRGLRQPAPARGARDHRRRHGRRPRPARAVRRDRGRPAAHRRRPPSR
jgi:hypothetical protein